MEYRKEIPEVKRERVLIQGNEIHTNENEPALKSKIFGMDDKKVIIEEKPELFDKKNIIFWSEHYKRLEGTEHGNGIQTKARKFLDLGCIEYVKKELGGPYYLCKPIPGYNSTTYKMCPIGQSQFNCSCQFYNKVCIKNPGLICSHVLALFMQIKIWNSEKRLNKQMTID